MNAWGHAWFRQHKQALKQVLTRFAANKLSTLLICLAIGVTLTLPSMMYTVLDSVYAQANRVKSESQMSVFLAPNLSEAALSVVKSALKNNPHIASFKFVSKADALAQLQASDANNGLLQSLEKNPLPDAYFVEPKQLEADAIQQLKSEIEALEGVDAVLVDGAWIKRLNYLLQLGKQAMLVIAGLLAFALVAVIGNTIRMQILTQQAEIELSRLIGATTGFIRRPFLYAGGLYGLLGGLLAVLITFAVIAIFNQSIAPIAAEYQTDFLLQFPPTITCIIICALALLLGLLSAYFAVSKSLSQAAK